MATAQRARNLKTAGAAGEPVATRAEAHGVAAQIMGAAGPLPDHVAHRETPRDAQYVSLRRLDYGGDKLMPGQVFRLKGLPNDKLMLDLAGYFRPIDDKATLYECGKCGAWFTAMAQRDAHVRASPEDGGHAAQRFAPPAPPQRESDESRDAYQNRLDEWAKAAGAMSDAREDQRDRIENEVAPLDLTRTRASREA